MDLTYADIELINAGDLENVRRHIIDEDEIKRINVNILVDTGAYMLCINENIKEILEVSTVETRKGQLANGAIIEYDVAGPIEIRFKNRRCVADAIVLKGNKEPILGAIPLTDMDVQIHPLRQELIVNPESPFMAQMKLK